MKLSLAVVVALAGLLLVEAVPLDRKIRDDQHQKQEEEAIDVLKQIWAKVPMDDLIQLIVTYAVDDEDFKAVVSYMLSDDFKRLQLEIEALPEIKALAKYLDSIGMDIYEYVDAIHELIGMPPIEEHPLASVYVKISGGLRGLFKDIRSILPIAELYQLFDEKMVTSSKFRDFIERMREKELQDAVNALNRNAGWNEWLKRLEARGVDFTELIELIEAVTGIKFPPRQPL